MDLWLGEVKSRAVKMVLVWASSRAEAEAILRGERQGNTESIDLKYTVCGPGRIIRRLERNTKTQP